ncbi:hypothetical protein [Macrococcoides caseolyticum]|uniref:hypothetical protein n=1 Tax=Macrococcoides caseolyticum TaxID=69966 RepID=UPI001E569AB6|nr:hypothetical protein [Macrococcus caseolyticus]
MDNLTYKDLYNSLPNKRFCIDGISHDYRTILAEVHINMFNQINEKLIEKCHANNDNVDMHQDMIKKLLINFIDKNSKNEIIFGNNNPLKFNLAKYYDSKIKDGNKYLNGYIDEFYSEFFSTAKKILLANSFKDKNNNLKMNYIYVTQRKDGMVCVVGKSHFKYELKGNEYKLIRNKEGDLFYEMKEDEGTGKILSSLYIKDDELKKQYSTCREFLDDYLYTAWIIPVLLNDKDAKKLEKELGDFLIREYVPILNLISHIF